MTIATASFTCDTLLRKKIEKLRRKEKDVRLHNRLSALLWAGPSGQVQSPHRGSRVRGGTTIMGRKSRQKRERRKQSAPARPMRLPGGMRDAKVIHGPPPGGQKMSEVLLEFVEPWSDDQMPVDQLRKLLGVAMLAWNAALMPVAERDKFVQEFAASVEPEFRAEATAAFLQMVQRKLSHFASNQRAIFDFQVTVTRDGPHVQVLSNVT